MTERSSSDGGVFNLSGMVGSGTVPISTAVYSRYGCKPAFVTAAAIVRAELWRFPLTNSHHRSKRRPASIPETATSAMAAVYQMAPNKGESSGQCRA